MIARICDYCGARIGEYDQDPKFKLAILDNVTIELEGVDFCDHDCVGGYIMERFEDARDREADDESPEPYDDRGKFGDEDEQPRFPLRYPEDPNPAVRVDE